MSQEYKSKKHVVAIIPARGGSKGLLGKNIKMLAGKPLLAYTIEAAKGCPLIDRVIVSTDSHEIAKVARDYGAEVPFLRPVELAADDTPTEPVLTHAVEWLEKNENYGTDIVVFLQPTDIFRRKYMLEEVVRRLLENEELDSAFVAYLTHKNFWRQKEGQCFRLAPDIAYGPRQKREPLYREDTGLACATRAQLIKEGKRLGPRVSLVINHDEASAIDIHDDFSFWLAEKVISEWGWVVNG